MNKEIWKSVDMRGFENRYEISTHGRIRSRDFTDTYRGRVRKGKFLICYLDRRGYPRIGLCKNYHSKHVRVHRLVALAFIPNPMNKRTVNHKDGIKTNNYVENLEWSTDIENCRHANRLGLHKYKSGESHCNFISPIQVYKNGILIDIIYGNLDAERKGYEIRNISACLFGRRKTHRNCIFVRKHEGTRLKEKF